MFVFLLSEQRLKKDFLNDNIASELILPSIQTAQDIYLKQTLGSALYETICDLVENNSVVEPYKTLLDDYIIIYLEYLAMAELCVPSTFKLGNIGIAQSYDSNVNSQSIQNVKYLESFYKQKASTYENRLVTYIQQNINYFPEYLATNEVVTAKESTLQTGLFLGGVKTKTTKRTTNNKNSLVGAVRYDQEQNLSEQQKQQARENIGVSTNGDINVDLENYYTKDEVFNKTEIDTKLIPYATTNEVNLRLNNYYDKNTVNNLLDNLPIPESTSELVKDDVYTKTEVDEKIANVSSGGSVDLSNYYTKDETYSKQEVNDLVANSGGGGGSDTPTNTCMSIGDNYIVDLNTAYFTDIEVVAQKAKANPNNFVGQLITYKGKETERCKINSDNNVVFSHDNITIDGSGDKSFDVELVQGTRIFNTTQQKYPDIPNNEIWYKTIDGLPFEKIYVNAESRGTPFSHQYYDSELGLYRAVWSEAMEHVPECFVIRDGYSGEELENTQVTHVYLNNYSKEIFNCFNNCVALVEVQLGTSSDSLNQTFRNCRSLREIFIPSNIREEYNESFRNCINLNTIILGGNYNIYGIPQNVGFNYKDLGVNRIYCTTPNEYVEEFAETNGFTIIPYSGTEVNIVEYQPIYTEKNNIIINQGGGGGGTADLSNYYTKQEVDTLIENIDVPDVDLSDYYNKQETATLIQNAIDNSKPIIDIMSLNYDEQLELIDFVIDNNRFPDLNTLYTYQGYVLNNLTIYSDWWNEENAERYVIFNLYAHPKSYDIRFITYQWNEGKIYNDIFEKDFNDWLVTNGEIDIKLNRLSNGLVLDLYEYDNDELAVVYNKIYYMGEQFTDKPITYRGKYINNITIEGNNIRFWHYAITTDSNNINSDKSFYVDVEMYDDIMGLVRTTYTEIGGCTVIGGNGGGTIDLSNYYTKDETYSKQETETAIEHAISDIDIPTLPTLATVATSGDYNDLENLPTLFDGDYNSLENKPTIPTATSQLTLDNVYNKSEIDLQFETVNATLGNINNILNTI